MIYRKLETRRLSIVAPPPPPLSILDNRARISFPTRGEKKEVRRKKRVFVLEGTRVFQEENFYRDGSLLVSRSKLFQRSKRGER